MGTGHTGVDHQDIGLKTQNRKLVMLARQKFWLMKIPTKKRNGQSQVSNGNPASRKYGGGDGKEGKFGMQSN